MSTYRELPIGRTGKAALIDADMYLRLARFHWILLSDGRPYRMRTIAGKRQARLLSHEVMNADYNQTVRCLNGNILDCRRENLRLIYGNIGPSKSKRNPYRAQVSINDRLYHAGCWPTAERARRAAAAVEVRGHLYGHRLSPEVIQRVVDLAVGRETRWRKEGRVPRCIAPLVKSLTQPVRDVERERKARRRAA